MDALRVDQLLATYRDGLLNSNLPFWFPRAVDEEQGGFMFSRDRDGTLLDTDKAIWLQGRASWLLATLYADIEARLEWPRSSRHVIDGAFHVLRMELTCWQIMRRINPAS